MRAFLVCLAIVFTASAASAGYVDSPQCRRDLSATDASLKATLRDLDRNKRGSPAQRCASYARHVEVMRKASGVFRQCATGRERAEDVDQMEGSIADFREIIARNCR
jgi:hypothetical protein